MPRIFVALPALLALLAASEAHADPALELILSCPEGANSPDQPDNPQLAIADCTSSLCGCTVYYANNSGQDLTNIVIHIRGEHTPDLRFADPVAEPDGSLAQTYLSKAVIFDHPNEHFNGRIDDGWTIGTHRGIFARFRDGSSSVVFGPMIRAQEDYDLSGETVVTESGFDVTVPLIENGAANQLQFRFFTAYDVNVAPVVGRILAIAEVASEPFLEMPTIQAAPVEIYRARAVSPRPVDRSVLANVARFPGTSDVIRGLVGSAVVPEVTLDLYLPYWNGSAIVADKSYDAQNPAHSLIFDISDGDLTGEHYCAEWPGCQSSSLLSTVMHDGVVTPTTGINAGKVLVAYPGTNRVRFRPGVVDYYGGHTLRYELAPRPEHNARVRVAGSFPNGLWCANGNIPNGAAANVPAATEECLPSTLVVKSLPAASDVTFSQWIQNSVDGYSNEIAAGLERYAISPDKRIHVQVQPNLFAWTQLTALEDFDIIVQLPGDDAKRMDLELAYLYDHSVLALPRRAGYSIQVHLGALSYGSEANLLGREAPPPDDPGWITCVTAAAGTNPVCDQAALTAASPTSSMSQVNWLRAHFPSVPVTVSLGDARTSFEIRGKATNPRQSIDGDTDVYESYNGNDMTHSSMGMLTELSWSLGGQRYTLRRPMHGEYESRLLSKMIVGLESIGNVAPGQELSLSTTPSLTSVGMYIDNIGAGPIFTPVTITFDLSAMPTFRFDGSSPTMLIYSETGPAGAASLSSQLGLPPELTADWTWNAATRLFTTTVRSVSGERFKMRGLMDPDRLSGESGGVYVRLFGSFEPGPSVQTITYRLQCDYEDLGAPKVIDWTNKVVYHFTGTNPAIQAVATSSASVVERHGDFDLVLAVHNRGYLANGGILPGGATGPATHTAMYYRVTRDGDFADDGGFAQVTFNGTSSDDALGVYVATIADPPRTNAQNLVAPIWQRCGAGNDCTLFDLASLGIAPEAVSWAALDFGSVEVSDAPPLGVPGASGPYSATVHLLEDGSDDGVTLFALVEVATSNTASVLVTGATDVHVAGDCDAAIPGVGFDQPEICDTYDNDCDGELNEGVPSQTVTCDGLCPGTGTVTCDPSGQWVNNTCAASVSCVDTDDCTIDACVAGVCTHAPAGGIGCAEDRCPFDPAKITMGTCGCGLSDSGTNALTLGLLSEDRGLGILVCGDYTGGRDIGGGLAVAGTFAPEIGFSVGLEAPLGDPDPQAANPELGEPLGIAYAGAIIAESGQFYGSVVTYGGGDSFADTVNLQEAGTRTTGDPLSLVARCEDLRSRSLYLCAATGTIAGTPPQIPEMMWWGEIRATVSADDTNLFAIDGDDLSGSVTVFIDNPGGFDTNVVFNVSPKSGTHRVQFERGELRLTGVTSDQVLFNFCDVTEIDVGSSQGGGAYGFYASLLAPFADVDFSNGELRGVVGVASLTGDVQLRLAPMSGTLDVRSSCDALAPPGAPAIPRGAEPGGKP